MQGNSKEILAKLGLAADELFFFELGIRFCNSLPHLAKHLSGIWFYLQNSDVYALSRNKAGLAAGGFSGFGCSYPLLSQLVFGLGFPHPQQRLKCTPNRIDTFLIIMGGLPPPNPPAIFYDHHGRGGCRPPPPTPRYFFFACPQFNHHSPDHHGGAAAPRCSFYIFPRYFLDLLPLIYFSRGNPPNQKSW